jgi:hypothetical protein
MARQLSAAPHTCHFDRSPERSDGKRRNLLFLTDSVPGFAVFFERRIFLAWQ